MTLIAFSQAQGEIDVELPVSIDILKIGIKFITFAFLDGYEDPKIYILLNFQPSSWV